ncbi:MAG: hypothetical protein R2911_01810 [Caldilineaceae bacterium]
MRMSLFTALVSGAQAGENVAAAIHGKQPQPLSYVWYGQGIALGPNDAVGFNTFPGDAARGPFSAASWPCASATSLSGIWALRWNWSAASPARSSGMGRGGMRGGIAGRRRRYRQ